MPTPAIQYHSTAEKDVVRERFDLPLLQQLHQLKKHPLRYFGLPGADALDLITWNNIIGEISAVDRDLDNLAKLEDNLETYFHDISYKTHHGEVDQIIIKNQGKLRDSYGEPHQQKVANSYKESIEGRVWGFDVVYLDYFGPFLPLNRQDGTQRARERTTAIKKLFETERVDGWHRWVLMITVDARLYIKNTRRTLRSYLENEMTIVSEEIRQALNFLLSYTSDPHLRAGRLIHGVTSMLLTNAANNARLDTKPRGTVLYKGSNNHSMVHMAFEFIPNQQLLVPSSNPLDSLLAPFLRPNLQGDSPRLELVPDHFPGMTKNDAERCLDFLGAEQCAEILDEL